MNPFLPIIMSILISIPVALMIHKIQGPDYCLINTHQTIEEYRGDGEYYGIHKGDLLVLLPCE